jgi:hypothetical protein
LRIVDFDCGLILDGGVGLRIWIED